MQMESLDEEEEEEDGRGLLNSDLDPRLTKINGALRLRFLSIYGTDQLPISANLEGTVKEWKHKQKTSCLSLPSNRPEVVQTALHAGHPLENVASFLGVLGPQFDEGLRD